MSKVIWDFAGGTLKNIGDLGGAEFDLETFINTGLGYDAVDKSVTTKGTTGYPTLRTKNTTNIFNKNFGLRLIFKYRYSTIYNSTIWGTEIDSGARPFRVAINNRYVYYGSGMISYPANLCDARGDSVNDLTFWYDFDTTTLTVTNNKNKVSVSQDINYKKTDLADQYKYVYSNKPFKLYLGTANYSGGDSQPGDLTFYGGMFTYDSVENLFDVGYLLKKDGVYYSMSTNDGVLTDVGSDFAIAKSSAISSADALDLYYNYLGEYSLIQFTPDGVVNSSSVSYEKHRTVDVYYGEGYNTKKVLSEYTEGENDILLKVPYSYAIDIPDKYLGERLITTGDRSLVKIGETYSKNVALGLSKVADIEYIEDGINYIGKPINFPEIHSNTSATLRSNYVKEIHTTETVTMLSSNYDKGLDESSFSENTSAILDSFILDPTMFNDRYEFDMSGVGIDELIINIGVFVSIKLPDNSTIISKPDWLSVVNNRLVGISNKSGTFKVTIDVSGVEINNTVIVSPIKRIK